MKKEPLPFTCNCVPTHCVNMYLGRLTTIPGENEQVLKTKAYVTSKNIRQQVMEDNLAKLTVYLESLDVMVTKEEPTYTIYDLVSDFGECHYRLYLL